MSTRRLDRQSKVCSLPRLRWHWVAHSILTDWDLVFADDERESNPTSFKFLQMAHAWKQTQGKGGAGAGGGSGILAGFKAATKAAPAAASQDDASSDVASSHGGESD